MDIESLLAEHLEPARRELERQRVFREQMLDNEIEVRSPDRTVRITQTCAGEILDIELASGAFGKHDERSLAEALKKAIQAGRTAGRQAAEQLTEKILQEQEGARRGR